MHTPFNFVCLSMAALVYAETVLFSTSVNNCVKK